MVIRFDGLSLLLLMLCTPAQSIAGAQAIEIAVIEAQYRTDLSLVVSDLFSGSTAERTETIASASPVSSRLDGTDLLGAGNPGRVYAAASAAEFAVSTETRHGAAVGGHAWATAETMLTFRVLQDVSSSIDLSFLHLGTLYSAGFVSLVDLTTVQTKVKYSWDCCGVSNSSIPWEVTPGSGLTALLSSQEWFDASHLYQLTMRASSFAADDAQAVFIGVSGLAPIASPVPEPETWAIAIAGLCMVGWLTRAQRSNAGRSTLRD